MFRHLVLAMACLVAVTAQTNYCDTSLCRSGTHIACNNSGDWSSQCPSNARMVDINPLKEEIVASHNAKRNLIAGGGISGFNTASRMATMQWNDELASLAALNVKQCVMKHDACRNTVDFKYSGQNLAYYGYSGRENSTSDSKIVNFAMDSWWSEYQNAQQSYIDAYPSGYSGPAIGHFTVMAADKNVAVGCAAARYFDGTFNNMLTACNYATTNLIGAPIYVSGSTASACTTIPNPAYPNLCTVDEKYKLN